MTHDNDTAMGRVVNGWLRRMATSASVIRLHAHCLHGEDWHGEAELLAAIATVLEAREDA